jgi:hypothetical protein
MTLLSGTVTVSPMAIRVAAASARQPALYGGIVLTKALEISEPLPFLTGEVKLLCSMSSK